MSYEVHARLEVISTKLPIVMDLIEIFTHTFIKERYEIVSRELHRYK